MLPAASLVSLLASPSPLAIASLISFIALRAATSPLGVFTPPPSLLTISPITSFTSFLLLATIALSIGNRVLAKSETDETIKEMLTQAVAIVVYSLPHNPEWHSNFCLTS